MEKTQRHRGESHGKIKAEWSYAATSQGGQRIASSHQKLGKRHGTDSPSEPSEGSEILPTP